MSQKKAIFSIVALLSILSCVLIFNIHDSTFPNSSYNLSHSTSFFTQQDSIPTDLFTPESFSNIQDDFILVIPEDSKKDDIPKISVEKKTPQITTTQQPKTGVAHKKEKDIQKIYKSVVPKKQNFIDDYFNAQASGTYTRETNPFYMLGAYKETPLTYGKYRLDSFHMGLKNVDNYCETTDFHMMNNPEIIFEQRNFFADYSAKSEEIIRSYYMRNFANDTMKNISHSMPKKLFSSKIFDFDPNINNFFTKDGTFHVSHKIGKHFVCATQMYNHIPGHESISRKDQIADSVNSYLKKYKDRPQCFNSETAFPMSYRLYIQTECKKFFSLVNSPDYQDSLVNEPMQYLIKKGAGVHRAQGVFLFDQEETTKLNKKYGYGAKCGHIKDSLVAQKYISNPLLLDLHNKFDFRVYMLIASTNPMIVYYHDGIVRVSVTPYDKYSTDRAVHLTNTFVNDEKFKEAKRENKTIHGMNEQQLRDYHLWTFEQLQDYLLSSGRIQDPKWLDNYLRPAFKKAYIHLVRMGKDRFWTHSNIYEMFGLDFMLDDKFNLWFIECNVSPQFISVNERRGKVLKKMLHDMFEIQYNYYKSRMTRVLSVILKMEQEMLDNGSLNLDKWRGEYAAAAKNKLEPQYKISENNAFKLIMDESKPGAGAYFGFIKHECL